MFRMSPESFYMLLRNIECEEIHKEYVGGNEPIAAEKMLLMTFWWLGKGEVLLSVADRFSISLSTTHRSKELTLNLLVV